MDTNRTLYEIEVALAKLPEFDYRKNIVVFNVQGISRLMPIYHECDMLVCSKSGYLTEVEIKRSWGDFLADFKKKHNHHNYPIIKYFYYCVPESIFEKVQDRLEKEYDDHKEHGFNYTGIYTYDEELNFKKYGHRFKYKFDDKLRELYPQMIGAEKLFLEQMCELGRLSSMRVIGLKEKIINLTNNK